MATTVKSDARPAVQAQGQIQYGGGRRWPNLITYLLLALGAALVLVPFAWMISTSLTAQSQLFIYPPQVIPSPVVWQN